MILAAPVIVVWALVDPWRNASVSGSGSLTYLYSVVSGGKIPAILQSPNSPMATIQFVSGPGTYIVQLTVTDGAGNTAVSAPITLTYTGA